MLKDEKSRVGVVLRWTVECWCSKVGMMPDPLSDPLRTSDARNRETVRPRDRERLCSEVEGCSSKWPSPSVKERSQRKVQVDLFTAKRPGQRDPATNCVSTI